jgi:hypothetical protein
VRCARESGRPAGPGPATRDDRRRWHRGVMARGRRSNGGRARVRSRRGVGGGV